MALSAEPPRDRWFPAAVILLLVALPFVPWTLALGHAPPGTAFNGLLDANHDVHAYYSFVHQARDGHWRFQNRHTTEPHAAAYVNVQWLAMGRLQRVTGWSDALIEHVWRTAGIVALLAAFWALLARFFADRWPRRIALLAFALGGGFGWVFVLLSRAGVRFAWDYYFGPGGVRATPFDVNSGLPFHVAFSGFHVTSLALFVLGVLAFLKGEETGHARSYLGAGLCGLALTSHPYEAVALAAAFALYGLVAGRAARAARPVALVLTLAGLGYLALLYVLVPVFRWSTLLPPVLPLHTLAGFGLAAVLAVLSLPSFLARARREGAPAYVLIGCVLVSNVALYWSYPLLEFAGAHRTTLMASLVIVGLHRLGDWWPWLTARPARVALLLALVAVNTLSPAVGYARRLQEAARGRGALYVDRDLLTTVDWLGASTAWTDVVLAPPELAHWVAGRAGNALYLVGPGTRERAAKTDEVRAFFEGAPMDRDGWLAARGIRWVLAGPSEGAPGAGSLRLRFTRGAYRLYEVDGSARGRTLQ